MQFSQVGNIEKIKKSKQFSQDEATERTRKGRRITSANAERIGAGWKNRKKITK